MYPSGYSYTEGVSRSPYIRGRHQGLQNGKVYQTNDKTIEVWIEKDRDGGHLNWKQGEYIPHYDRYDTEIKVENAVAEDMKQMVKEFVENDCLCDVAVRKLLRSKVEEIEFPY